MATKVSIWQEICVGKPKKGFGGTLKMVDHSPVFLVLGMYVRMNEKPDGAAAMQLSSYSGKLNLCLLLTENNYSELTSNEK